MVKQCVLCRKVCYLNPNLSFHRLPANPDIRKLWMEILQFPGYVSLTKVPLLCSDHFGINDFVIKSNGKKYLRKDAVPHVIGSTIHASEERSSSSDSPAKKLYKQKQAYKYIINIQKICGKVSVKVLAKTPENISSTSSSFPNGFDGFELQNAIQPRLSMKTKRNENLIRLIEAEPSGVTPRLSVKTKRNENLVHLIKAGPSGIIPRLSVKTNKRNENLVRLIEAGPSGVTPRLSVKTENDGNVVDFIEAGSSGVIQRLFVKTEGDENETGASGVTPRLSVKTENDGNVVDFIEAGPSGVIQRLSVKTEGDENEAGPSGVTPRLSVKTERDENLVDLIEARASGVTFPLSKIGRAAQNLEHPEQRNCQKRPKLSIKTENDENCGDFIEAGSSGVIPTLTVKTEIDENFVDFIDDGPSGVMPRLSVKTENDENLVDLIEAGPSGIIFANTNGKQKTSSSTLTVPEVKVDNLIDPLFISESEQEPQSKPTSTTLSASDFEENLDLESGRERVTEVHQHTIKKKLKKRMRYIGDLSSNDFSNSIKTKRDFKVLKAVAISQRKKIKYLNGKVRRLKTQISSISDLLKELKQKFNGTDTSETAIRASILSPAMEVFNSMLHGDSTQKYTPRSFAPILAFYSTGAYNFVRRTFNNSLPHIKTISKCFRSVDSLPGFTEKS